MNFEEIMKIFKNTKNKRDLPFELRNLCHERWDYYVSALSSEKKAALEELDKKEWDDIKPIPYKRHRNYFPDVGDIFLYKSHNGTEFQGLVINNYLKGSYNENSEEWICIVIFKPGIDAREASSRGIVPKDLIDTQKLVGRHFWTSGFFRTVDHIDTINICCYGYCHGKGFVDDFKRPIKGIPDMWKGYGYTTEYGIVYSVEFYLVTGIDYAGDFKI